VATKIRLQRIGAKKKPFYRVVVMEKSDATDSSVIDYLGTYNPHTDPPDIKIDLGKVDKWIEKGSIPSTKIAAILKRARKIASTNTETE